MIVLGAALVLVAGFLPTSMWGLLIACLGFQAIAVGVTRRRHERDQAPIRITVEKQRWYDTD